MGVFNIGFCERRKILCQSRYLGWRVRCLIPAESKKVRLVTKVSSSEFKGLLVGEWVSVPLSGHVVFPTNSKREVGLSSPSDPCQISKSFFFVQVRLFSIMHRFHYLSGVSGNYHSIEFILFYLYSYFLTPINCVETKKKKKKGKKKKNNNNKKAKKLCTFA